MLTVYANQEDCCGCTACCRVCPVSAITMEKDKLGFLYPKIDQAVCTDCGLCRKVCDFTRFKPTERTPSAYAVKHVREEEVEGSRSGAFFIAVADLVFARGGVVFGSVIDDDLIVRHTSATNREACRKFKGSKYVQSRMDDCFSQCLESLRAGRWVLFSGTGCQVHGLLRYLQTMRADCSRLITIDIVCHGVPSEEMWDVYRSTLEKRLGEKIVAVDFRDKKHSGWAAHTEKYVTESGKNVRDDAWARMYCQHIMFRDSCYRCGYTTTNRLSDFTIGDFWGIGKAAPEFNDNKGCSLVLVHTDKAAWVFEALRGSLKIRETGLESAMQPQLQKPPYKGVGYRAFRKAFAENPSACVDKYFFPSRFRKAYLQLVKRAKRAAKAVLRTARKTTAARGGTASNS
jgi:coenzyme F420-reducing hydrogenase beta subunit